MYKRFFGLQRNPFGASPDPDFVALMPHTREALAGLEYGITFRKGIVVLSGEVGTGKTTLLRSSLHKFANSSVHFSYVFNPRLEPLDFLEFVLTDFGVEPVTRTKAGMLLQLNRWLIECFRQHETCVIMIDEAQNCSWELLEEIRLLTNLETSSEKLVQVILAGQPELETKLRQENARQLRQRVALWCRTYKLTEQETAQYMQERLHLAGTDERIFTENAVLRVHQLAGGIPRLINLVCEHALILAYVNQQKTIGSGMIEAVSQDLMLEEELGSSDTAGSLPTPEPAMAAPRTGRPEQGSAPFHQSTRGQADR